MIEEIDIISSKDLLSVENNLKNWQESIVSSICDLDPTTCFYTDNWQSRLGNGITKVVTSSKIFESAGVNFSCVKGESLPAAALPGRSKLAGKPYMAMGVSTVIHPRNPYVPTSHANLRFFVVDPNGDSPYWWFGGCYDLTPYYGFTEDCVAWHRAANEACSSYGPDVYTTFKAQCDKYFYLPHRQEPRGIGGIFFDNLSGWGFDKTHSFVSSIGRTYIQSYAEIVRKRSSVSYGRREKSFQEYRRGRYVEFNLLHDRGTKFGIDSGGRTESILMSLPPVVSWRYAWSPEPGSPEDKLYTDFLVTKDWVNIE